MGLIVPSTKQWNETMVRSISVHMMREILQIRLPQVNGEDFIPGITKK
jgi:hypothetical protein